MHTERNPSTRRRSARAAAPIALSLAAAAGFAAPASAGAVDLTVDDVVVTQAIRFFNTPLIAGNPTFVRVFVDTPSSQAEVDARLHVFVDGVEAAWSPIYAQNGPITAPPAPNSLNLNDSLNFTFVAPESSDVDLLAVVNPFGRVPETNLANNTASVPNLNFQCRDVVEIVSVPINYTPGGGLPLPGLIEPGIGDGFLRAIYKPGAWDYHQSPLPTFSWTQSINGSSGDLLNALRNIRVFILPANGYPAPDFVYGWLPGNPFSGNGQAIGIPGDAAFGNTDPSRHQRTFAHEIGHCLDESHNGDSVGTIGVDVEHHLLDTQDLNVLHPSSQNDIMVAGQLTHTAFVSSSTYNQVHGDARFQCTPAPEAPGGTGGADDRAVLRVSGVIRHDDRDFRLDPVLPIERGRVDPSSAEGDLELRARAADGRLLHVTVVASDTTRESCADPSHRHETGPVHKLIPAAVEGTPVAEIEVVDRRTGAVLAARSRTAHDPEVAFTGLRRLDAGDEGPLEDVVPLRRGMRLEGRIELAWSATDGDGDAITYALLYTPDAGASWLPMAIDLAEPRFELDMNDIPRSVAASGRFKVIASDGFGAGEAETPEMLASGAGTPELYLMTPNNGEAFGQGAMVIFHAAGWDPEDLRLDDEIQWLSNVDGVIGTGALLQTRALSPGLHTITALALDSDGMPASDTVFIGIAERTFADPDLDGDGMVGFADLVSLLGAWGPCPTICPADLDGSGAVDFGDLLALLASWS